MTVGNTGVFVMFRVSKVLSQESTSLLHLMICLCRIVWRQGTSPDHPDKPYLGEIALPECRPMLDINARISLSSYF